MPSLMQQIVNQNIWSPIEVNISTNTSINNIFNNINKNNNNEDDDDNINNDDDDVIKDRVRLQLPHRPVAVGPAEFFCLRVWQQPSSARSSLSSSSSSTTYH